jgi:hypothetical protein
MAELLDIFSDSIRKWFTGHGTTCGWLLLFILHLYIQSYNQRRVLGMRKGDGFWLMPPRLSPEEIAQGGRPWWKWALYTVWHPKRPSPMRTRKTSPSRAPPLPEDPQEAKTPKMWP